MDNQYISREYLSRLDIVTEITRLIAEEPIVGAVRHTWPYRRLHLRENILSSGGDLSELLTWPTVTDALFSGRSASTVVEYEGLDITHKHVAVDPPIGSPWNSGPIYGSSATYIRQAYALQLLSRLSGEKISDMASLYEFGGGYGALAHVAKRLGFMGAHMIYDLPELSLIQRWFHGVLDLNTDIRYLGKGDGPELGTSYAVDSFIAICSLEEADEKTRRSVLDSIHANYYLIWFTAAYLSTEGNPSWFTDYFGNRFGVPPTEVPCPHGNQKIVFFSSSSAEGE